MKTKIEITSLILSLLAKLFGLFSLISWWFTKDIDQIIWATLLFVVSIMVKQE